MPCQRFALNPFLMRTLVKGSRFKPIEVSRTARNAWHVTTISLLAFSALSHGGIAPRSLSDILPHCEKVIALLFGAQFITAEVPLLAFGRVQTGFCSKH